MGKHAEKNTNRIDAPLAHWEDAGELRGSHPGPLCLVQGPWAPLACRAAWRHSLWKTEPRTGLARGLASRKRQLRQAACLPRSQPNDSC